MSRHFMPQIKCGWRCTPNVSDNKSIRFIRCIRYIGYTEDNRNPPLVQTVNIRLSFAKLSHKHQTHNLIKTKNKSKDYYRRN